MAARFPEISEEEIQKLAENAVNKNAVKTKTWMNVWKSKVEGKGLMDDLIKYKDKEPDDCLLWFFAEICKSDGSHYVPDNLRGYDTRHLKQNNSKISTVKDQEFVKCRQVLEGKELLPKNGHGKQLNATKALFVLYF